ncbi:hypothetical protein [Burkholderia sp. Ac-20344]|uniref:hypothetical protein n=1 Tax=Burkholderia sp. Ac-20344 TaxID=2703890 RepID=UPI00197BE40E|nr:hypothetical protein [Burkholderia sp. Ac-20344]
MLAVTAHAGLADGRRALEAALGQLSRDPRDMDVLLACIDAANPPQAVTRAH